MTEMTNRKPSFPETRSGLEAAGYQFLNRTRCRACPATIEFWRKVPNAPMPMEELPDGRIISHFRVCPQAERFRKEKVAKVKAEKVQERLSKKQTKDRERAEKIRLKEAAKGGRLFK